MFKSADHALGDGEADRGLANAAGPDDRDQALVRELCGRALSRYPCGQLAEYQTKAIRNVRCRIGEQIFEAADVRGSEETLAKNLRRLQSIDRYERRMDSLKKESVSTNATGDLVSAMNLAKRTQISLVRTKCYISLMAGINGSNAARRSLSPSSASSPPDQIAP